MNNQTTNSNRDSEDTNSDIVSIDKKKPFMTPTIQRLGIVVFLLELTFPLLVRCGTGDFENRTLAIIFNEFMKIPQWYKTFLVPYFCYKLVVITCFLAAILKEKLFKWAIPYIALQSIITTFYFFCSIYGIKEVIGVIISDPNHREPDEFFKFVGLLISFNLFQFFCLSVAYHVFKAQLLTVHYNSTDKMDSPV